MHHNQEHLNPMSTAKDVWVLLYWFFIWNHNKETVKNTAYNSYHTLKNQHFRRRYTECFIFVLPVPNNACESWF